MAAIFQTDARGRVSIAEPTDYDHTQFLATVAYYSQPMKDLYIAAERLQRAYDHARLTPGNQSISQEVRDCEHEYDRRRHVLTQIRRAPKVPKHRTPEARS